MANANSSGVLVGRVRDNDPVTGSRNGGSEVFQNTSKNIFQIGFKPCLIKKKRKKEKAVLAPKITKVKRKSLEKPGQCREQPETPGNHY